MRAAFVTMALMMLGGVASADHVDDLVEQLTTSADYKERLSAVASLSKDGDQRAIAAFIAVLVGDQDKTVRGAAAVGLGKVVTAATSAEDRKRATDALKRATKDEDSFVKKQAKKALARLKELDDAADGVSPGDIHVELGSMTSNIGSTTPSDADLTAAMQKTLEKTFHRDAEEWLTELPADVDVTQLRGYYVDGSVNEILSRRTSGGMQVRCKVSIRIASSPGKDSLGFVSGGATVTFDSISELEAATYDCVEAVIENLVRKKVIPAISDGKLLSASSGSASTSGTGWSNPGAAALSAPTPATDDSVWSPDGWTLLGEDEVDLIDDEVEVDRRKSTWSEVAIVVTGDGVQLDTVELGLAGKGRKRQRADIGQSFDAESGPRIIELTGKRRSIDKVRLTYTKHTLDAQTRVQVWAR